MGAAPTASEFQITTSQPAVSFGIHGITPPAPLYVARDDRFLVLATTIIGTSSTITVRGRFLRADGVIVPFSFVMVITSAFTVTSQQFELGEGFLLSCTIVGSSGSALRGATYAQVAVVRGGTGISNIVQVLLGDYVTNNSFPSWPPGRILSPVEGPGYILIKGGTVPAAGADISETVTTGARWRLIAFRATLTTSATVANRQVALVLDDSANIFAREPIQTSQVASQTINYTFQAGGLNLTFGSTDFQAAVPADNRLLGTWRIRTVTQNLQVGDTWGQPVYVVEQWIEQ